MRDPLASSPCVVVGIDGSRAAMQAAMWAVDEAIDHDVPLTLLYAIDSDSTDPHDAAAEVADAQNAVHQVFATIESTGKSVKMESEIIHSSPIVALLQASRSASMLCVGSIGFKHAISGRIGSTASALAVAAHCPVAIVPRKARSALSKAGLVLAVVDGSPAGNTVLERSVAEAVLRAAPLRIATIRHAHRPDADHTDPAGRYSRRVESEVEHRLAHWQRNHPDLDIDSAPVHGGLLNYVERMDRTATPIQLVVVDPSRPGPLDVLLGPSGRATLDTGGCTLLICDRQWWS